jgi:hypothetical protein
MAVSSGVMNYPVSVADVKGTLGLSSDDVKTLCQSNIVKMTSKYKPTDYTGIGFALNTEGIELAWRGTPKNGLYIGCGFTMPAMVVSPSAIVSTTNGNMTLSTYLEEVASYPYAILDYAAGSLVTDSTRGTITVGRLSDFYRYTHNSPHYNYGSYPFSVSCSLPQAGGKNVIDAGAIITYDYENIADGIGAHLGVKDFFTMVSDNRMGSYFGSQIKLGGDNGVVGYKFFGVMVWCPRSGKSVISRSAISRIDNTNDPVSGNPFMRAVFFPTLSLVDTDGTKGFKYGDTVRVMPFILAKNTTPNYVFYAMNQFTNVCLTKELLGASAEPTYSNLRITKITGTLTFAYVSSREFDIYFNASNSVSITCANYISGAANRIYYTVNMIDVVPNDSTGYVQDILSATLGNSYDDKSGYRYSTFTSNSGNGANLVSSGLGYNYMRTRIKFSGSGSSAKVAVSIPVWQNNGSTSMTSKYFTLVFTIDPRNTSTFTATAEAT